MLIIGYEGKNVQREGKEGRCTIIGHEVKTVQRECKEGRMY